MLSHDAKRKGQRPEPAAPDVPLVCGETGWLPFAGSSGSPFHTPLIKNNTLTAHTDNNVPTVTGINADANAHHSIIVNSRRLRSSANIMHPAKQTAGVTTTVNIQNIGVADQSTCNPLVAKYSQAAASHRPEQTISATESAAREISWRRTSCVVLI